MDTNFSPFLGVLNFKPIPKYCNVLYEGILCISQWSDTGPSWPSCYIHAKQMFPGYTRIILSVEVSVYVSVCVQNSSFYQSSDWGINPLLNKYSFCTFAHQQQTAFENIVGKEEIAYNEQFLLFPMFFAQSDNCTSFVHIFDIIVLFATELEEPKIGI